MNRCNCAPLQTHRQGWLLCTDGARHARNTACSITSRPGICGIVSPHSGSETDPRKGRVCCPESLVLNLRAGSTSRSHTGEGTNNPRGEDQRLLTGDRTLHNVVLDERNEMPSQIK